MENLGKKVGFLKGLMEGGSFDADSANGKLLAGIVGLLGDLSDRVEAIDELLDDLNDYVESIDEDLSELEGADGDMDDFFEDDDDALDFDDDDDELFPSAEDKLHLLRPAEAASQDDESLAGNLCPKCSRMFFTSLKDDADAEYICPHCGERIRPVALTPDNAPIAKPADKE